MKPTGSGYAGGGNILAYANSKDFDEVDLTETLGVSDWEDIEVVQETSDSE